MRTVELEQPHRQWSIGEIATFGSSYSFYPTMPLGMLADLAERVGSPQATSINVRLEQEAEQLDSLLRPTPESPRKLVQTQLTTILLSALAMSRAGQ